jgi:hypothetical protein
MSSGIAQLAKSSRHCWAAASRSATLQRYSLYYPAQVIEATGDDRQPLKALIGGVRGALESILPPLAFVATYVALSSTTDDALTWAIIVAVALALIFAVWRLIERKRPTRVIGSLIVVALGAYVAARTGSAAAFFWPRVLLNVLSALAFVIANLVRWPLLGLIMGPITKTGTQWRKDPALLRAYTRASWWWVLLNLIRAAVLLPLIASDSLWGLAASGAFFYVLVIVTIALSWMTIKRSLPPDHPGIRHPRITPHNP